MSDRAAILGPRGSDRALLQLATTIAARRAAMVAGMTYRDTDTPSTSARRRCVRAGGRAARPAESREQILRAATREFVTHGFAGARVNRIVKKAGSNPRMIYHYFGSKSRPLHRGARGSARRPAPP